MFQGVTILQSYCITFPAATHSDTSNLKESAVVEKYHVICEPGEHEVRG